MKPEYDIGREVWIAGIYLDGALAKGKIVHKFKLDWGPVQYVIEVPTTIDPLLEVRNYHTISEDGKELNLWKRLK